jgi:hypothetical protein
MSTQNIEAGQAIIAALAASGDHTKEKIAEILDWNCSGHSDDKALLGAANACSELIREVAAVRRKLMVQLDRDGLYSYAVRTDMNDTFTSFEDALESLRESDASADDYGRVNYIFMTQEG